MRKIAVAVALLATGTLLTSCAQTSGNPSVASSAAGSSSSSATATPTRTVSSAPLQTVTVTSTSGPSKRVVTHVVHAPSAPRSYAALSALLDDASVADNDDYTTSGGDGVFFDAPSQNIGCYMTDSATVECAIHDYDFPQPGPDCDNGIGATMDAGGDPGLTSCSGYFPVANRGGTLQYGQALEADDIACISESAGVSCLNEDTHTGFTLSKQAYTPVY